MGESTEELSRDIARTRSELSRDVDEFGDKVSPRQAVERRKQAVTGRFASMKQRVMGSAHETGHSVGESASGAVHGLERRAEGNPLAAGVIAFGAGMLLSSALPASRSEQRLTEQGMGTAKERGRPVMEEAKSVAGDLGEELKQEAREGVDEVRSTAQDSARNLKDEGEESAQSVRESASGGSAGTGSAGSSRSTM